MIGQPPEDVAYDAPSVAALRQARARRDAALRRRLVPVALLAATAMIVTVSRDKPGPGASGASLAVAIALGGLVVGIFAIGRFGIGLLPGNRPWVSGRFCLPMLGLLLVSSAVLYWFQPGGSGVVGLYLAVAGSARVLSIRRSGALLAACLVFFGIHQSFVPALGLAAVYTMALFSRRIRAQEQEEERLLVQLEETRGAEVRAAALAERQRLARDMHDVLAHSLSGLVMQLEGARLLAASAPDDERLPATIDRAHQLAKNGLSEARQAIAMLRDEELPGPERAVALAKEFEADTGIPCRFTTAGEPRVLGSGVRLALYRVAQEALTNIRKHASPDRVDVRLEYLPAEVSLLVEDHGAPPSGAEANGGYGITGMRERAELLGGAIDAGPTEDGFRVRLRVPA
ncbi:MAG TPA: sensor histidine kinase [Streptosporangiaceae bacterium]